MRRGRFSRFRPIMRRKWKLRNRPMQIWREKIASWHKRWTKLLLFTECLVLLQSIDSVSCLSAHISCCSLCVSSLVGWALVCSQFISLQKRIDDRSADINKLKQERQRLLGLIRSLESDIEDLKRQISGHEKTSQDKVTEIRAFISLTTKHPLSRILNSFTFWSLDITHMESEVTTFIKLSFNTSFNSIKHKVTF